MAFDQLIISSVTSTAKSGLRMGFEIDSLEDKLKKSAVDGISSQLPNELPFNVAEVLNGGDFPDITPSFIGQSKVLPKYKEEPINNTLDGIELVLNTVIQTTNTLKSALDVVKAPLTTLESLGGKLGDLINGLKATVGILTALPLPTSVPPGVGIPAGVINGFSSTLDTLKSQIDQYAGPLSIIPQVEDQINRILDPIILRLNLLNLLFRILLKILIFIRTLLRFGNDVTQAQIDSVAQEIANNTQAFVDEEVSTDLLDPNSNTPTSYRDFTLVIENNPTPELNFPSRRIRGVNSIENVTLYNLEDEGYSFSASVQVLIEEIRQRIDTYYKGIDQSFPGVYSPFGVAGFIGEKRRKNLDFYIFQETGVSLTLTATSLNVPGQWVEFTPDLTPFQEPGNTDGSIKTINTRGYFADNPALTSGPAKILMDRYIRQFGQNAVEKAISNLQAKTNRTQQENTLLKILQNQLVLGIKQTYSWDNFNMKWDRIYPPFTTPGEKDGDENTFYTNPSTGIFRGMVIDNLLYSDGVYSWNGGKEIWNFKSPIPPNINPPSGSNSININPPSGSNSININPPSGSNSININPPSGSNPPNGNGTPPSGSSLPPPTYPPFNIKGQFDGEIKDKQSTGYTSRYKWSQVKDEWVFNSIV